eukprot:4514280-Ditylum_brightwellii.AAC.1
MSTPHMPPMFRAEDQLEGMWLSLPVQQSPTAQNGTRLFPPAPQRQNSSKQHLQLKLAKYLRVILEELSIEQRGPTTIYEDNAAAIMMANISKPNDRTRHIDISYFAIQKWVSKGDIKLAHIRGVIIPSDALTKALGWMLHCCHVSRMMGHVGSHHTNTSGRI